MLGADANGLPVVDAGAQPPVPPAPGMWTQLPCLPDGRPDLLSDLSLTREIDHAALYQRVVPPQVIVDMGIPCATATDTAACSNRVASLLDALAACALQPCAPLLLTTAGDAVDGIETQGELIELLGTIESKTEAWLVASFHGVPLACGPAGSPPYEVAEARSYGDGYQVRSQGTADPCARPMRYELEIGPDGEVRSWYEEPSPSWSGGCPVEGRRPAGLVQAAPLFATTRLGAHFARAARFEAASIVAFERLARELSALGASSTLVSAARRAAVDEIAHAHAAAALARRFGGEPANVDVAPIGERSPFAVAVENAMEGCAGETFAALVAHHQCMSAADPMTRAVFARIAEDESRHAQLAWRIAAWLEPQLSRAEQRFVSGARNRAFAELAQAPGHDLDAAERRLIGYPDSAVARALAGGLAQRLGA